MGLAQLLLHLSRGTATSSVDKHLAYYPCTVAGSWALAGHLREDHG